MPPRGVIRRVVQHPALPDFDGDSSDKWHPGYGGGVWFAPLARTNAIRLTVAHSEEDTLFYMGLGFGF